jgi:hypothetical protein
MTRFEASYLYRRDIAAAISQYGRNLRTCFAAWGSPIPPTQECMSAMGNAWGTCRVRLDRADRALEERRAIADNLAYVAQWETNCLTWRGF